MTNCPKCKTLLDYSPLITYCLNCEYHLMHDKQPIERNTLRNMPEALKSEIRHKMGVKSIRELAIEYNASNSTIARILQGVSNYRKVEK